MLPVLWRAYWISWHDCMPSAAGCKEDTAIIKWLAHKHGVAVIPGSACGYPGHIRVAFGKPEVGANFEKAAARLRAGLEELVQKGPSVAKL